MPEEVLLEGHDEEQTSTVDELAVSRRWLLLKIGVFFNAVVGIAVAVPVFKYLLSPAKPDDAYKSWISLGSTDSFPVGETRLAKFTNPVARVWDGETDRVACWVRRIAPKQFQVFAINCAHLGCPVRWFPQSGLFMCPCHGGVYYADGARASGPPERGLFEYNYKVVNNELRIKAGHTPTLSNQASLRILNNVGRKGCGPCAG